MTARNSRGGTTLALLLVAVLGLIGLGVVLFATGRRAHPAAPARPDRASLVAADHAFMHDQDVLSRQRVPTWTLGYMIASADPAGARVLNWLLTLSDGQARWSSVTVAFRWDGGRWVGGITFIQPLGDVPHAYGNFTAF